MADDRLKLWEPLFERALTLIDSVARRGIRFEPWSFGGGTVLMLRYRHRVSKDIDIFVPDPQWFGLVSPRLNPVAESMTREYVESGTSLKLVFPDGEIDFIASDALTALPTVGEVLFGRNVQVQTTTEIIAKKVWHRGWDFKARDVLDLAVVADRDQKSLAEIRPVLREKKKEILDRMAAHADRLRADFAELDIVDKRLTYDRCAERIRRVLERA